MSFNQDSSNKSFNLAQSQYDNSNMWQQKEWDYNTDASSGAAANKYQIISSADVSVNEAMSRFSGSYTAVANGGLCQPIVCPDLS